MSKSLTPDLDHRFKKLFQSGRLIQVHVSRWSMIVNANKEDLGLDNKVVLPEFLTMGKKALFTDDVRLIFSRLESQARRYLQANSLTFPLADAHFVPMKRVIPVMAELEKIKESYLEEVESFIQNYEQHKLKMFEEFPDYKDRLLPHYPSQSEIRQKFDFSVNVYEIAFPKKMSKVSTSELLAQTMAAEQAQEKYENLMKQQYDQQLQQMQNFLSESAKVMRGEIVKTFEVMAQKIQNKEVISTSNLKTIKNTIESFDGLDFLDDRKIKENLAIVKKLISSGADFKDDNEAVARLQTAVNTTLEAAKNLTDIDSLTGEYTRFLDMED